jgi:hypothetical protein
LQTEYRVHLKAGTVTLRIGVCNSDASQQLSTAGMAREWAIVTPFNPGSVRLCEGENAALLENFVRLLKKSGHAWFPTSHCDPTGVWPTETGAFIADIKLAEAIDLGRQCRQKAIVHGAISKAPQLVWLE